MGAKALLDINLIWFGHISRLSHWGGEGYFTRSNDFYLHSPILEGGAVGGRSAPCGQMSCPKTFSVSINHLPRINPKFALQAKGGGARDNMTSDERKRSQHTIAALLLTRKVQQMP
jgi:hypothetical protein